MDIMLKIKIIRPAPSRFVILLLHMFRLFRSLKFSARDDLNGLVKKKTTGDKLKRQIKQTLTKGSKITSTEIRGDPQGQRSSE